MDLNSIKFETIRKATETKFKFKDLKKISQLDSNSPPSVFVGSKLPYPRVNVGILSPLERDENAFVYDDEPGWARDDYDVGEVVRLRSSLLNSRFEAKVKDVRQQSRFVDIAKQIAMAAKPVDIEIKFKKDLNFSKQEEKVTTPHGMRASLDRARITSNPKIPQKIDKVANDELKAVDAMAYLRKNNFSEYTMNKILSMGILGLKKNKVIVPTRWSITATDDTLGKQTIKKIRDYNWIEDYEFYFGGFMGNYYLIFLFPGVWSYELFEVYFPGSSWNPSDVVKASTDYENYYGRKKYASNTVGGYYAARLPIVDFLEERKKQASVLAIRLETPSYWAALGVWVVRESVKKAMATKGISFRDMGEMLNGSRQIGQKKFDFDPQPFFERSKLLKTIKNQKTLKDWF